MKRATKKYFKQQNNPVMYFFFLFPSRLLFLIYTPLTFFFLLPFVSPFLFSVTVITFPFTSAELIVIPFISVKNKLLPIWSFMEPFGPLRYTWKLCTLSESRILRGWEIWLTGHYPVTSWSTSIYLIQEDILNHHLTGEKHLNQPQSCLARFWYRISDCDYFCTECHLGSFVSASRATSQRRRSYFHSSGRRRSINFGSSCRSANLAWTDAQFYDDVPWGITPIAWFAEASKWL